MGRWIRPKNRDCTPWKPEKAVALPSDAEAKYLIKKGWGFKKICKKWIDSSDTTNRIIGDLITNSKP